jgi:type I restriction enzyme S subunit
MGVKEASAQYVATQDAGCPVGYKQTEVGVIPEDWSLDSIGGAMRLLNGRAFKPSEWVDYGLPIIRIQNLNNLDSKFNYFSGPIEDRHRIHAGDLLFAWSGTTGSSFGARIWDGPEGALNQHIFKVVPDLSKLTTSYAYLVLLRVQQDIEKQAHGFKSSFVHVKKSDLVGIHLPFPRSRAEQEAIAKALSDTDALIESMQQLIAKKRQIKQGAMQELLTGKRRLPGFSGEWRASQLGEVIDHCSSGATPYRGRPEYYKGAVKWISSGELNYNTITDTIEHISEEAVQSTNLKVHPVGTFLMAITGLEAAGTRGACGMVGSPSTTNQSCMAIYPSSNLGAEYLFHYYRFRGDALALQYCQGTKQQSYTAKLVKILPIELPPSVDEQVAIVAVLSDMDAEISSLETKLAKTRQLKRGMMLELLTGRIRLV